MEELSQSTIDFIRTHSQNDVRSLALQALRYPKVNMPVAIVQIAGKQIASNKIPSWQKIEGIRYPRHLSLEQCSSEVTARYKASLTTGNSLTDLTGGFGIDCAFLAENFQQVTYIERQKELCDIANHNFALLGLTKIAVYNKDAVEYLEQMSPTDWIFLDPARRNEHGGKTVSISDCEPNAVQLEELLLEKACRVLIKLSPMLDLTLALRDLKQVLEVHVVSVNNECKELLLVLGRRAISKTIPIYCLNLCSQEQQRLLFTREEEQTATCTYADQVDEYLYEPNASILKAGAFRTISSEYKIKKLHPNSHLYTSNTRVDHFPGRIFHITKQCSLNKKELKETLGTIEKANITVRNFPATVAEIRKRTKLSDGGEMYLFATTLNNEKKVLLLCRKIK